MTSPTTPNPSRAWWLISPSGGSAPSPSGTQLTFTRCPFRAEVGLQELPIVCAIHQGFVDGYLEASASGMVAGRIDVGPRLCHLALQPDEGAEPRDATTPVG